LLIEPAHKVLIVECGHASTSFLQMTIQLTLRLLSEKEKKAPMRSTEALMRCRYLAALCLNYTLPRYTVTGPHRASPWKYSTAT
jgi:hypothetical protein